MDAFELGRAAATRKSAVAFAPAAFAALLRSIPWLARMFPRAAATAPRVALRHLPGMFARRVNRQLPGITQNWWQRFRHIGPNGPQFVGPNVDNVMLPWMIASQALPLGPLSMDSPLGTAAMLFRYPKFQLALSGADWLLGGGNNAATGYEPPSPTSVPNAAAYSTGYRSAMPRFEFGGGSPRAGSGSDDYSMFGVPGGTGYSGLS